jgi:hypothetical protein
MRKPTKAELDAETARMVARMDRLANWPLFHGPMWRKKRDDY